MRGKAVKKLLVYTLIVVALLFQIAIIGAADEQQSPVQYSETFLPPHVEAGIEVEIVLGRCLPQGQDIALLYYWECQKRLTQEQEED